MRCGSTIAAFILLWAVRAQAQTTPLWKLACTPQSYPLCNASAHEFNTGGSNSHSRLGTHWTAQYLAAAGPSGEDVVRISVIGIHGATVHDEFYMGWVKSIASLLAPTQGSSRFFRWTMRIVPPVNWFGMGGGRWGTKFIIGGSDGTNDGNRLFSNLRSSVTGTFRDAMFRTEKNVSAGRLDLDLPASVWLRMQLETHFSTTTSTTDAALRHWINNGNRNAPNGETTGYNWSVAGWSGSDARVAFGGYAQGAEDGSTIVFDLVVSGRGAFEYDDEWDPTWHTSTAPTPPAAPTGVRVIGAILSPSQVAL